MTGCNWIASNGGKASNRRALLIGINYTGSKSLTGTVRDVKRIAYVLRKKYGYKSDDLLVLTDSQKSGIKNVEHKPATRANMLAYLKEIVHKLKAGDKLVVYFAGHGKQTVDLNIGNRDREDDGLNENILPQDHATSGFITDDVLNDILVKNVPKDVLLTSIMDCCHSGTLLDLPYVFDRNNIGAGLDVAYRKTENATEELKVSFKDAQQNMKMKKMTFKASARQFAGRVAKIAHDSRKGAQEESEIEGNILLLSACKDDEKSLTATEDGLAAGAMTNALIKYIRERPDITLEDVIRRLRTDLESKNQTPQMTTSKNFDASCVYLLE